MSVSAQLPSQAAIPLAAALVQTLADEVGTRLVFVKGVAAVAQGLRDPRASADVDAIVDPAGFDALVAAFMKRGWRARFTPPAEIRFIPGHSVTLVHADWPCDLDLHYFFVGTFAEPAVSFEALWDGNERHPVAGRDIVAPSVDAHRVILAVNTVRDTGSARAAADADKLGEHFRAHPGDWNRTLDIATRTRSLSMLRHFAATQGLPEPEHDLNPDEYKQLTYIIKYHSAGLGNLRYQLGDPTKPLKHKMRVLMHFLYKPASTIALENPAFTGGHWATFRANGVRFRKGLKQWSVARKTKVSGQGAGFGAGAGPGVGSASGSSLGDHGRGAFSPVAPVRQVTYAELRQTSHGIVLENAPAPVSVEPVAVASDVDLEVSRLLAAECARFESSQGLYLMSLDHDYLLANPSLTPLVVHLDESGAELLQLLSESPKSVAELSAEISVRHHVEIADVREGVEAFVRHLLRNGVLRVE